MACSQGNATFVRPSTPTCEVMNVMNDVWCIQGAPLPGKIKALAVTAASSLMEPFHPIP